MPRLPSRGPIAVAILAAGGALAVFVAVLLAAHARDSTSATSHGGTKTPLAACDGWGAGFASLDDAESRAGYHIPRAPASYQPRDRHTCLQFGDPPMSHTDYGCEGGDRKCISVDVVPSRYDVTNSREHGRPTTIGDKSGWMLPSKDGELFFSWKCGQGKEGSTLYCTVLTLGDVDQTAFDTFVASLK